MGVDGYTELSAHLTQIGWEQRNPRIRDYANDTSQCWAKALYDFLTSPAALSTAVMAYLGAGGDLTQINRHADMLLALSPDANQNFPLQDGQTTPTPATYASLYHSRVLATLGVTANQQVNFPSSAEGKQQLADYIAQWFTTLMTNLATSLESDLGLPAATRAMYYEIEIELTSINEVEGGFGNLANELVTAVAAQPGAPSSPNNLLAKVQSWAANSRLAKGVVKVVQTAAIGYSLYTVIGAFSNWSRSCSLVK